MPAISQRMYIRITLYGRNAKNGRATRVRVERTAPLTLTRHGGGGGDTGQTVQSAPAVRRRTAKREAGRAHRGRPRANQKALHQPGARPRPTPALQSSDSARRYLYCWEPTAGEADERVGVTSLMPRPGSYKAIGAWVVPAAKLTLPRSIFFHCMLSYVL